MDHPLGTWVKGVRRVHGLHPPGGYFSHVADGPQPASG